MNAVGLDRNSLRAPGQVVGLLTAVAAMLFGLMALAVQSSFAASELVLTASG